MIHLDPINAALFWMFDWFLRRVVIPVAAQDPVMFLIALGGSIALAGVALWHEKE